MDCLSNCLTNTSRRLGLGVSFLLLSLAVAGCGGPSEVVVSVQGKLTNNGQPLEVAGRDIGLGMVQLKFIKLNEDGSPTTVEWATTANPAGEFTVVGREGYGIPPGKYKISVQQWDPYPQTDKLKGAFSPEKTKIIRDLAGKTELNLDVSKPEG